MMGIPACITSLLDPVQTPSPCCHKTSYGTGMLVHFSIGLHWSIAAFIHFHRVLSSSSYISKGYFQLCLSENKSCCQEKCHLLRICGRTCVNQERTLSSFSFPSFLGQLSSHWNASGKTSGGIATHLIKVGHQNFFRDQLIEHLKYLRSEPFVAFQHGVPSRGPGRVHVKLCASVPSQESSQLIGMDLQQCLQRNRF